MMDKDKGCEGNHAIRLQVQAKLQVNEAELLTAFYGDDDKVFDAIGTFLESYYLSFDLGYEILKDTLDKNRESVGGEDAVLFEDCLTHLRGMRDTIEVMLNEFISSGHCHGDEMGGGTTDG